MALDGLKFMIEEDPAPRTRIRVFGVGGGGSNAVGAHAGARLDGRRVLRIKYRRAGARIVAGAVEAGHRLQDYQWTRRGLGPGGGPASRARRHRAHHRYAGRRRHGVRHCGHGRRHRNRRGAGGGFAREGTRRADGGHRHQRLSASRDRSAASRPKRAWRNWPAWRIPSSPFPTTSCWNWFPRAPVSMDAFRIADDVLRQAVQGISDIINTPGLVNRDFSDVRSIMTGMGYAMMGTATARGENGCVAAAQKALHSPLMESGGLRGARGVLLNITGSSKLGLHEVNEACTLSARGRRQRRRADQLRRGARRRHGRRGEDHSDRHRFRPREYAEDRAAAP